jgi:hypothetical protein
MGHTIDTSAPNAATATGAGSSNAAVAAAAAVGAAVSLALGVYARQHAPTGEQIAHFGFSGMVNMKVWLTTAAFALALAQVISAAWMWGRLPRAGAAPRWLPAAHRWSGTFAFVLVLPVAYHCLWSLGFRDTDARVLVHSLLGCAFFGAITTKLLALRSRRMPRWAVPVFGGLLAALLCGLWFTSALWFFRTVDFPAL